MAFEDELKAKLSAKADAAIKGRIAYHEAAHALVGILLGETLISVTMDGHTTFEPLDPSNRDQIVARAKIALAGTVGEAVGMGSSHPGGPKNDFPQAVELLNLLGPDRPRAHELSPEVRQMVLENEQALHRIARALRAEGTLTGDRVKGLSAEPESP
jgi:ATP-dependent Zn protease